MISVLMNALNDFLDSVPVWDAATMWNSVCGVSVPQPAFSARAKPHETEGLERSRAE